MWASSNHTQSHQHIVSALPVLCICCSEGHLKSGAAIIAELMDSAALDFAKLNTQQAAQLASVFDRYQLMLRWQRLLDFDDLLHHCLALMHSNEKVSRPGLCTVLLGDRASCVDARASWGCVVVRCDMLCTWSHADAC